MTSQAQRAPVAGQDEIDFNTTERPFTPPLLQEKLQSTSSNDMSAAVDEKKASAVEPYVADPERQSDKVGSLNRKGDSEKQGGSLFNSVSGILGRFWKKVAQLVAFMVFTALVPSFMLFTAVYLSI